ncbi:NAD(P)-dependent dehydrogenase (short-subunit alcohol dehydrogenase family) [Stella humosa]|uniref:NAD(P)-dependent dehydrogenase (Short-subunit alcohol dehydrogenase family) n=1 Tax=Stella humosa TaxID=94 RepID=A0A3N1L1S2_9PROT|nr:SDR family oxidoreductase [Stella humosa]ROP84538.1 NAD(P)-dependent dehydrogenase (short-subunit alcohol dehydrogenase family) [Stella humosa]
MSVHAEATGRVVVTGGSSGIGEGIVRRLHGDGYAVVNLDIQAPKPDAVGQFLQVDLGDAAATQAVLAAVLADGPVTRLVNNVGIVWPQPVGEVSLENVERSLAVNLRSAFLCFQALLPGMQAAGFGRVVNISSRTLMGKELRTTYGMSKGGLLAATRTWALEFAQQGITVNAIGPGPINTELFQKGNPPGDPRTDAILRSVPMRRFGEPAEVAHAVASLLDARAGFITGQILYVCGGQAVGVQAA